MTTNPPPKRGGIHPIYGTFIGGSELDDTYKLTGTRHYRFTGQRRGPKVVNSIEQALLKTIDSNDAYKFNGNLEKTESSPETEIDKETFIKQLQKKVRLHGQQSFYAIMYQTEVLSLFDHYHKFTVEEVIDQHEYRSNEPAPVIDPNTQTETPDSIQLRFESYDEYEFDEFGLSRLVVESLLAPTLLERIATRFGNDPEFETYPGQVIFMMALDTCNASVQRDVAGAQKKYEQLSLDDYPGENVTELATEALRLIHILSGSYALPLNLGTTLIKKVTKTSSEFFNRKMFTLLDAARTLENKYRLLDPATMGKDNDYTSYGPYAVCTVLQEEHGKLIADSDWPALAVKLPESNVATPAPEARIQCYKCNQWGHKANDPKCPLFRTKAQQSGPSDEAADDKAPSNRSTGRHKPKDPWKYVEPKDISKPVIVDGKKWFFCSKCRCRATGQVGFYQLSHTDSSHDPNWTPESNLSPVQDPDPSPPVPLRPPSTETAECIDDDLVFTGVNLAPVVQSGLRLASLDERETAAAAFTHCLAGQNEDKRPRTRHTMRVHSMVSSMESGSNNDPLLFYTPVHRTRDQPCVDLLTNQEHSDSDPTNQREVFSCGQYLLATFSTGLTGVSYWYRTIQSYLYLLLLSVNSTAKYYVLLGSSIVWYFAFASCARPGNTFTTVRSRKKGNNLFYYGFPAKWLILSIVMIRPQFMPGHYFEIGPFVDKLGSWYSYRTNSVRSISRSNKCSWKLLYEYNYDKVTSCFPIMHVCNHDSGLNGHKSIMDSESFHTVFEAPCTFYDTYQEPDDLSSPLYFFDADEFNETLIFPDLWIKHHAVDVSKLPLDSTINTAPAVSSKAELELLTPQDLQVNMASHKLQPIIFDTGASLAITGDKQDFLPSTYHEVTTLKLGGMAAGASITGVGDVAWTFACSNGDQLALITKCYHVPSANSRLLSPQKLFDKQNGQTGKFWGDEDMFHLQYDRKPSIDIPYSLDSNLPIGYALTSPESDTPQVNTMILDEDNQNLTAGQKLLLEYHYKFGHTNMPLVQQILRSEGFTAGKFAPATKCVPPKCAICEMAKGHRKSTKGQIHTPNPERQGTLKVNDLRPGATVSVDHFESRLKGRTFDSFGKATSDQYIGGCIFVDHSSGYVHIEFQLGFSAIETIRAKQNFEQFAFNNGVIPITYLTDSGAFKANKFVQHIRDHNQKIKYCGTNAHHQNGVAERSIRTISNMARAMILHASAHWKHGIDASMWPMAVKYSTYIYNALPRTNGISPCDLFFGTRVPRHKLRNLHVWGCPVYVLNPSLQAGKKIPRWEPRSKRGVFCGLSTIHSSEVPQVLNLTTGSITTQFHVVFDDLFTTVPSIGREEDPPSHWADLCLDNTTFILTDNPPPLSHEWRSKADTEDDFRIDQRSNRVRNDLSHQSSQPHDPLLLPSGSSSEGAPNSEGATTERDASVQSDQPGIRVENPAENPASSQGPDPAPSAPSAPLDTTPGPRRSARSNKGIFSSTRYINEVFLSSVEHIQAMDASDAILAYHAELQTDMVTSQPNITDPRIYNAKFNKKKLDPDSPTFHQAMSGDEADKYIEAMKEEVTNLKRMNTWVLVDRQAHMKVLKGTWAFKLKRTPDGVAYRYRSRFCVRGDQQEYGVNYFETFAPVIQWSTIRLVLIFILTQGWTTRVIDYTNAFPQANIDTDIFVEMPALFGSKQGTDKVLKLKKSLYGLKQSPRTFYQHLSQGLKDRGWTASAIDPCLFMKHNMMCVIYVDDTIFTGPNQELIENEIKLLGIKQPHEERPFEFRDEGELSAFLGIKIEKQDEHRFYLSQPGLIEKVLTASGMMDCKPNTTPSALEPLGPDEEGEPMNESWEYASILGMLMYLANNTRPDIAHAVHACARYTHAPKKSHATAVKHILRYLKGTMQKGMVLSPNSKHELDCFVDSDFAGNYKYFKDQDPTSTKSRTGYVIMYQGCPILWVSKLQTQCALSTMESVSTWRLVNQCVT